jgi:hypothetical protein
VNNIVLGAIDREMTIFYDFQMAFHIVYIFSPYQGTKLHHCGSEHFYAARFVLELYDLFAA